MTPFTSLDLRHSSQLSYHQLYREDILLIIRKIELITETLFKENGETPEFIEQRYTIRLLQFFNEDKLTTLFLQVLGFPDARSEIIEEIASKSVLCRLINEDFIPALNRFCYQPQQQEHLSSQHDLKVFIENLLKLRSVLKLPSNEQEHLQLYHQIRTMLMGERVLYSPFYLINEDLKKSFFSIQIELLKSIHENLSAADWESDIIKWNEAIGKLYNESIAPDQTLKFHVQQSDIPIVHAEMPNLICKNITVSFHALPLQFKYIKEFAVKGLQLPKTLFLENFSLQSHKDCNCMSFAVGRKGPGILTPNGQGTTPNRISQFHKELIENGCINIESFKGDGLEQLTEIKGENNLVYLTAFVFGSGGSETGQADFHVYRCFFDPNKGPIWMELAQAKGGIQFSKIPDREEDAFILGIPANPKTAFCKAPWDIFAGYWLIPPEANFEIKLRNPASYVFNKATFVRFVSSIPSSSIEEKKCK